MKRVLLILAGVIVLGLLISAFFIPLIFALLKIGGALGLFLFGMKVMSGGIQRAAGERMHSILNHMTSNRFFGVLTGLIVTALVQSSSATTVMIVSFVNAGLLSLGQAISVIMGANIGTTVTAWLITLVGKISLASLAYPIILIGIPMVLSKRFKKLDIGDILIGFAIIFIALDALKGFVPEKQVVSDYMQSVPALESLLLGTSLPHFFLFVLIGALVTFIVQSSSAAMAVTLTLAGNGVFGFYAAAAMVLGENIGTTITAALASLGANRNAKRAAAGHFLFNVLGVVLIIPIFKWFTEVLVKTIYSGTDVKWQLAIFHTLFNIANTFILIWFVPQIVKVVKWMLKEDPDEITGRYELKYISTGIQDTSELNLLNAKAEITKMMVKVQEIFSSFQYIFSNPNKKLGDEVEKAKTTEDYLDQMQEQLSKYLVACELDDLNVTSAKNVNSMIRIVHELENIGDDCYKLILLTERKYKKKVMFNESAVIELGDYLTIVENFLSFIKDRLNAHLPEADYAKCKEYEDSINQNRNTFKKSARDRLQKGGNVQEELLLLDMVSQIEHIGDNAINVAQALREIK